MTSTSHHTQIRADNEIRPLLDSLRGERSQQEPDGQQDADALLARVIWSRLTEPGDAVAGEVIASLGALPALDLLAAGTGARAFDQALRAAGATTSKHTTKQLGTAIKRWLLRLDRTATVQDLKSASDSGMTALTPSSQHWPIGLESLGVHAPHMLWVRGAPRVLASASLAVVGARACTGYGSHVTAEFTNEACTAGFTIISGAAYGVDAVAHRTALAGEAPTIAVLAGGSDRPYPASHDQLIGRITAQGAVCSELVPGSAPTRWRFLQRNRLIAALSQAVLVTEAGVRSGTLNTAGHGSELGRPLGAVPGPVTSAASAGCHRLIREYGASLIANGADLLELLGVTEEQALFEFSPGDESNVPSRPPSMHLRLLDALPLRGGRSLTEAAGLAGVSTQEASGALAELELLGYVAKGDTRAAGEALWVLLRRE